MSKQISIVAVMLVVIGFLAGSTIYFFSKSQTGKTGTAKYGTVNQSSIVQATSSPSNLAELAKPAEPKGRLSYPAYTYPIGKGEGLVTIASKMNVPWSVLKKANSISDENKLQAGQVLVIPIYNNQTDYYRIEMLVNADKATQINLDVRDKQDSDYFDPVKIAKQDGAGYFQVSKDDQFRLLEADLSQGIAYVEAKTADYTNIIGLIQPKTKGKNGLWAVQYIERKE